jgi:hypothetical protein
MHQSIVSVSDDGYDGYDTWIEKNFPYVRESF